MQVIMSAGRNRRVAVIQPTSRGQLVRRGFATFVGARLPASLNNITGGTS